MKSPLKQSFQPETTVSHTTLSEHRSSEDGAIHVDEPGRRSVIFSEETPNEAGEEHVYSTPILAEDEVRKHPSPYDHQPAVEPPPGAFEAEEGTSRPSSRPSLYRVTSMEHQSTPLEDVEEYEPLFPDDAKADATKATEEPKTKTQKVHKQRFPSRDIWEDAPDSVYYTAHVSTPDVSEESAKAATTTSPPPRDGETPAQAFARHQEELAEKEFRRHGADSFPPNKEGQKPIWAHHQSHLAAEKARPSPARRFPSRDVWEDTPDSLRLETTVSNPQRDLDADSPAESKPEIPGRPVRKPTDPSPVSERPAVPQRPKPKQSSSEDDVTSNRSATLSSPSPPTIPDRPKPQIPVRPVVAGPTSGGLEPGEAAAPPKRKPAVPARPMGSKLAALQAGFMSDLNKKLGLGPQAPKKEEPPAAEESLVEPKEKVPLSDARKGRARGPQRRAPAKSPSPATVPKVEPALAFTLPSTVYEIDPEGGEVNMGGGGGGAAAEKAASPEMTAASPEKAASPDTTQPGGEKAELEGEERQPDDEARPKDKSPEQGDNEGPEAPPPEQRAEERAVLPELEDEGAQAEPEPEVEETKSLATNMAGEPVVEETLKVDERHDKVEPTKVEER